MAGIAGQIIGSFEDIGKDVVRQTATVPKDIVGKAIESFGTSGKKQGQQVRQVRSDESKPQKSGPLSELSKATDEKTKKAIARSALEQLAGGKGEKKQPTVWENMQQELEQKKQRQEQEEKAKQAQLQPMSVKKRRGDLYGMKAKKASAEMSRNVRQD